MALALFSLGVWQVAGGGAVRGADERLGDTLRGPALPVPGGIGEFFADLGNAVVAVPVLVAVLACVAWRDRGSWRAWAGPLGAVLSMSALPGVVVPLKAAVGRAGPPGMDGTGYFPSGHGATAGVAYGATALLVLCRLTRARARHTVATGTMLLNAAIGLSLVRRGYHWPLDVLSSWCLVVVLLWPTAALMTLRDHRSRAVPRAPRAWPPRDARADGHPK